MKYEIPKFEIKHLGYIEEIVKKEYSSIKDFIKSEDDNTLNHSEHEKEYIFNLNLESFTRHFFNNDIIKKVLENKLDCQDFIEEALDNFLPKHYIFNSDKLNRTITFLDNPLNQDRQEIVHNLISSINQAIESMVNNRYGNNFQFYFKEINQEAQDDLIVEYDNSISKIFLELLEKKVGAINSKIILNTTASLLRYDCVHYQLENNENKTTTLKLMGSKRNLSAAEEYKLNEPIYESITENPYVKSIEFLQKNNNSLVKIHATEETKKMLIDLAEQATKQFFNTPIYTNKEIKPISIFQFRVNDGKGNDCDIYKSKTEKSYLAVFKGGHVETLEGLSKINPDLYKNAKTEIDSISKNKKIKNKL